MSVDRGQLAKYHCNMAHTADKTAARRDSPKAILKTIQAGLPFKETLRLQSQLGVDPRRLAQLLMVSERTMARRKEAGKLEPEETDRALRLERVFAKALSLFEGDADAARSWLKQSLPALEDCSPMELIATDSGTDIVENLIGRLESGVYS